MGAYCAVYRCVTGRGYLTCAECLEYPCTRLKKALKLEQGLDSFVSHRPAVDNLEHIRKFNLESFLGDQHERRLLAERLIADYNGGRSMTLYCTACALLPVRVVGQAIDAIEREVRGGRIERGDRKALAKRMRSILTDLADLLRVDLSLRHKKC